MKYVDAFNDHVVYLIFPKRVRNAQKLFGVISTVLENKELLNLYNSTILDRLRIWFFLYYRFPNEATTVLDFCRIKNLKNTPIYVRPQFSSGGGVVTVTVMVGIRANVGKPVDNITLQLVLPPSVASSDLTANHGSVLPNHTTKVLVMFVRIRLGSFLDLTED